MKKEQKRYWKKVIRTINLFKRYFADELNDREKEMIENWEPDKEETQSEDTPLIPKTIEEHGLMVKKKVFEHLGIPYPDEDFPRKRKFVIPPYLAKYASIAAIALILIGGSYFLFNYNYTINDSLVLAESGKQLFAQTNELQTKEITMPDGTRVHINGNSRIEYIQKEFGADKREIWIEGEAFFDVEKNPEKPFIIHSGDLQTTVRGTSFNVKAYKEIGEINVSVRSGKVEVGTGREIFGMLTAGNELVYNEERRQHAIKERNREDAAAWMEKRLVLRDANVNELKIRLKQLYGMTIIVEGNVLAGSVLNASYPNETKISSILQGISEIYSIRYSIDEKNKVVRMY